MKIGVLGTGAYGMALSNIMFDNNHEITMWTKFEDEKKQLDETRANYKLIPNFELPQNIKITTNIEDAIIKKDLVVIAIPAAFIDSVCQQMKPFIKDHHILIATKGIEQDTGLFIHQIIEKYLDTKNIAVISGPSFAIDLITKMPAGLSLASKNEETELKVKKALENSYIKLRSTKDIIGIEVCGAIKNVIALAAGMLDGLGANDSTTAMLLTEAIHDMMEIINSFDGDKKTVLSFAGFGDLLLTCTSTKSRNYSFGKIIGERKTKKEIDEYLSHTTVEGFYTLKSIYKLLRDKQIKIPIIDLIYDITLNNKNPEELLTFLVEKA